MNKFYTIQFFICLIFIGTTQAQGLKTTNKQSVNSTVDLTLNNPNADLKKANSTSHQRQIDFEPATLKYSPPKTDAKTIKADSRLLDIELVQPSNLRIGDVADKQDLAMQARSYLQTLNKQLVQENPAEEWEMRIANEDKLGNHHIRMQQVYKGIKVFGGEIVLHSKSGKFNSINGRYFISPDVEVEPALNKQAANEAALEHVKHECSYKTLTEAQKQLLNVEQIQGELVIYHPSEKEPFLAYHLTVHPNFMQRFEYFLDAHTGEVLNHFNHTCSFNGPTVSTATDLLGVNRSLNTYESGGTFYMYDVARPMFTGNLNTNFDGALVTLDMQNKAYTEGEYVEVTSNSLNNWSPNEVSAHYNSGQAYDYFRNTHNRNSINGRGGNIISFINVRDENGANMDNAFWNGNAMFYGNGAQAFNAPLAKGKDVAGHEMSHGVIQNTANLTYQNESGAINESFADVFGAMIDREDWLIGEDVVNPNIFRGGALRSMSDPHNGVNQGQNGWQPRHVNEQYTGNQDNGGVHINSGIPNYAFFLFASNGSVGKSVAEDVYYHALTNRLTASSNFRSLRAAIEASISDLNLNSNVLNAARSAFDQVGITGGGTTNTEPSDIQANTGDQFILSYDTDDNQAGTWYLVNLSNSTEGFISNTKSQTKPSVTDNGEFAYYVNTSGNIIELRLDGQNIETPLSTSGNWGNVAISKDGRRLAAVSNNASDNKIYVFDLTTNPAQGSNFTLYNPTFTDGISTGEVLYADALEWDYSGQYVVYDAFNRIDNITGNDYEFWDVGFLRAWNNSFDNFGDGTITKLFSNLPQNVSIGEPSFSKNSPSIIAFDELVNGNTSNVLNANIETGSIARPLTGNSRINQPNYSVNDRNQIYNNRVGNRFYLGVYGLATDKLSASGNSNAQYIPDAKWGVWYAKGNRALPTSVEDNVIENDDLKIAVYPNPVADVLTLELNNPKALQVQANVVDVKGSVVTTLTIDENSLQTFSLKELAAGNYFLNFDINGEQYAIKLVKVGAE